MICGIIPFENSRKFRETEIRVFEMIKNQVRSAINGAALVIIAGIAFSMATGSSLAQSLPASDTVTLSKDNAASKLDAEFEKYMSVGAPDAMCQFGMEGLETVAASHASPKIIGSSKIPGLKQNQILTWSTFRPFDLVKYITQK